MRKVTDLVGGAPGGTFPHGGADPGVVAGLDGEDGGSGGQVCLERMA